MNPINYAKGLMDELEGAVRTGATDLAAQVRAELEKVAPEAKKAIGELRGLVDPVTVKLSSGEEVPSKAAADIRAVGERLDAVLGDARPARMAKAAAAPEKTVPSAAK